MHRAFAIALVVGCGSGQPEPDRNDWPFEVIAQTGELRDLTAVRAADVVIVTGDEVAAIDLTSVWGVGRWGWSASPEAAVTATGFSFAVPAAEGEPLRLHGLLGPRAGSLDVVVDGEHLRVTPDGCGVAVSECSGAPGWPYCELAAVPADAVVSIEITIGNQCDRPVAVGAPRLVAADARLVIEPGAPVQIAPGEWAPDPVRITFTASPPDPMLGFLAVPIDGVDVIATLRAAMR
jgi:hypothetical protein